MANKAANEDDVREKVLAYVERKYESDAAFERALGLKEKTVNNWRRGKSASFMKMLPALAQAFSVNVGELLDIPLAGNASELSGDELALLRLYRRAKGLKPAARAALDETLRSVIDLYLKSQG